MPTKVLKAGDRCPYCYQVMNEIVREDLRSAEEKQRHPISREDLKILNCSCLHPGDLYIGGFF